MTMSSKSPRHGQGRDEIANRVLRDLFDRYRVPHRVFDVLHRDPLLRAERSTSTKPHYETLERRVPNVHCDSLADL